MAKKFERVLSEEDLVDIFESMGYAGGHGTFLDIANEVQQAVLAKLAEQEPVASVSRESFSSDGTSDIMSKNLKIGTKLYTHPAAKSHIARIRNMVPEGWQLVRIDPSEAQCFLIAKECGFETRHSSRVWSELLAAAPKYTGESK